MPLSVPRAYDRAMSFRDDFAADDRDWWRDGRSADDLGLAGISLPQIKAYLKTGVPQE
jgi:hypothetical protein